jgi:4-diphosphocytidyl-2-C-methyl-D-erythritol kinase
MPPTTPEPALLRTVAPAKINWTLEVLGRRPDGYHEIRSVIQTVSLEDRIELRPSTAFSLHIEGAEAGVLTVRDNLVTRTAHALPALLQERPVALTLVKSIPAAAGLGGGSSDAAATLRLLSRYWRLGDAGAIAGLAAALGSDVPFFLRGGTQLASSRGESVRPLPTPRAARILLATPPISIPDKTARLFARLHANAFTDGERTADLAAKLAAGRSPSAADYVNVFDEVADDVFPRFAEYRRAFERATGDRALLAGAGPTLFSVREESSGWHDGRRIREILQRRGFRVWIVNTIGATAATRVR